MSRRVIAMTCRAHERKPLDGHRSPLSRGSFSPALQHGPGAIAIYLLLPALVAAAVWLLASRPAAGSVSRAIGSPIAGISLCDAALLASTNETALAITAFGGFVATLVAQKYVAGT